MGISTTKSYGLRLLFCSLLLVERSLSRAIQQGPTLVAANNVYDITWTRDGVSQYTESNPLNVSWRAFLKFQCAEEDDDSRVYVVRADVYKNISDACTTSGVIPLDELCIPRPIVGCQQDRLEKRVYGENDTALSCTTASFIPGNLYYLANFPKPINENEPQRCLFSMPLRVCDSSEGCASTETPSPSTTINAFPTSVLATERSRISSGEKSHVLTSTVKPTPSPISGMPTTLTLTTSDSSPSATRTTLLTLFICLSSFFMWFS